MRKSLIVAAALFAVSALSPLPAGAASKHGAFCSRWHEICVNGSMGGCKQFRNQEACRQTCASRQVSCNQTGCFPFNKGGSKCDGKA